MGRKGWFTLATVLCRTIASTKAKPDGRAIAPGPEGSRAETANCRQITGHVKCSGAADMALGKKKSGRKDACYHKVKSRYKVWPSAYASGALVKCRKVGAKNWGNG